MIINEAELKRLIREAVQEALEGHTSEPATYLSVEQTTEKLGISRPFCERLIREEGLPVIRLGRSIRIKNSSLDEWMEKRESASKVWK
ncbi:hypothetical protein JY98_15510 [Exiguobacterium mexicanum]|nr:hypothetical protein JY98_15510 [Exiguobacterium mexicanum]